MSFEKNDMEVITLNFDVNELLASGVAQGNQGDFVINFSDPITLNPMDDYQIGLQTLFIDNPLEAGYPPNQNSIFIYCDIVEASRVGSGVANVLHKTINASDIMEPSVYIGGFFWVKIENTASIMDWRKLNE